MSDTAFNAALFRTEFPEFSDTAIYPDTLLSRYWTMGSAFISPGNGNSWAWTQQQAQLASDLVVAHMIKLYSQINVNQTPGVVQGATEGSVSVQLVPPPIKNGLQYWLMQTPYGQQLRALLEVVGSVGIYVGGVPQTNAFRNNYGIFGT